MIKRYIISCIQITVITFIMYVASHLLDFFISDYLRYLAKLSGSAYIRSLSLNFPMMLSILSVCLVVSFFTDVKFPVLLSSVIIYVVWDWFEYYLFIWLYGLSYCLELKSEVIFASKYMITIIYGVIICYLLNYLSRKLQKPRAGDGK